MKPRVAVDLRALVGTPTGIGVYTLSLLRALARRGGFDYLGLAHAHPEAAEPLAAEGVDLECQRAPLGLIWQQLLLPRRLRGGDVDLLWSPLFTLPRRLPVPGVVTVHDLTVLLHPETHRLKVRLSLRPFLAGSLERAARVVAVSHATADDVARHFPGCAPRLEVIHSGVDPEFRPAAPEEVARLRADLGCPDGYVLYAGTLEPRKNVGVLLDAWSDLRSADERTPPLVIAGPRGWGERDLSHRLRALEGRGVHLLGRVPRPRLVELFQAARAFVYPSLYEGFGLPPLEAMACGVPVVVSDVSSLPEVVGDAGLRVAPGDGAALARALRRLLADPGLAAELAERGLERAGGFRWERTAAAMEEVFAAESG